MKTKIILMMLATALIGSCSKDDDKSAEANVNPIVGTWQATELKIDNETASDDAKNGRDALNFLTAKDCYVITFTFNQDLTVVVENSVSYIEIVGLDIPCPTQKDTDNSTYTYEGTTLALLDSTGKTVTTTATIDGNTLTIDANDLDIPDFNVTGQLLFKRQ